MLNKLSLNTIGLNRIGLNRIGKPSRGSSVRPYIDPEVLASLKAVCICYGKSNDDPDRAIVKNLVDPDNPFIISNAAYKLNSGYGLYAADFTTWTKVEGVETTSHGFRMVGEVPSAYWILFLYNTIVPSCKIRVSGIPEGGNLKYASSVILKNGINEIPEMVVGAGASGFTRDLGTTQVSDWIGLSVEQIPSYQGAFVTDGVDDLITSTKTVQEMLGGSNEITIVSMVHQVKDTANNVSFTNYIRGSINGYFRNIVNNYGKTGIYGYTSSDLRSLSVINNILGDKNDYTSNGDNRDTIINGNFSVQGYSCNNSNNTGDFSSVAWYWTVIANKVLTTDQINQVIAYYNLDRCVEPTVLYDVKRQGLSNDTPDSDWYLKDFSKNGFDMSLFNFAKKGNSGIGKYEVDFTSWTKSHFTDEVNASSSKIEVTGILTTSSILITTISTPIYNVEIHTPNKSIVVYFQYNDGTGINRISLVEGINELPSANESIFVTSDRLNSKGITITQIPSHAGALCLDGVNDYGKVTGLPIYKDYTVVADYVRTFAKENVQDAPILSKSQVAGDGAFLFNYLNVNSVISSYSFGTNNVLTNVSDSERKIYYQSKYVNGGKSINSGTGTDYDSMWLGTYRDDSQFFFTGAIYSLMTFPYSMSEFLIERQLKKHKLGTLYPDMVEFRPVITTNTEYNDVVYYAVNGATWTRIYEGEYIPIGQMISITINLKSVDEISKVVSSSLDNISIRKSSGTSNAFDIVANITSKSPQKIDITIDEYIRYEDIVQPYPEMWVITQNAKKVSWGDKLKVGSEFGYNSKVNLLSGLYSTANSYYNGKVVKIGDVLKVEKQMVFACDYSWIGGTNEPKCILSPSRLRIPNSSYKILGYIPDISGHGNHGVIHNSAYALNSGANGYPYDYTNTSMFVCHASNATLISGEIVKFIKTLGQVSFYEKGKSYKGKIKVTGITDAIASGKVRYLDIYSNSETNDDRVIIDKDGIYDVNIETEDAANIFFYLTPKTSDTMVLDKPVYIEQVGEYEGAYCLDGVDDFITIPTLSSGGKQVLMKVNWQSSIGQGMLYDQRGTAFAIWNSDKYNDDETDTIPAYSARNGGNTYIDGILNKNILASRLRNITHNIVATNTMLNGSSVSPTIGCRTEHDAYFTNMSLYDFMLFDEISTDEEILTLNEYVGIEGNTDDLFTENN